MRKSTNKLAASVQKAAAQEKNLSVAKSADKSATTKNGTEKGAAGKNGHAKKPSIAVDDFFADATSAGLDEELRFSTWDLRPFTTSSNFLVAVLALP